MLKWLHCDDVSVDEYLKWYQKFITYVARVDSGHSTTSKTPHRGDHLIDQLRRVILHAQGSLELVA